MVGFKELYRDLLKLDKTLAKRTLRKALRAGGKLFFKEAKRLVPVDTGRLMSSLKLQGRRSKNSIKYEITTGYKTMYLGDEYYGAFVEYGTKYQKEQGFIRYAFDDNKNKALNEIQAKLDAELRKLKI